MDLATLLENPPWLHQLPTGEIMQMGLAPEMLQFIDVRVDERSHTLETGAGISTMVFAMKGARHIAITPEQGEIGRIKKQCEDRGIDAGRVTFLCQPSEQALPTLVTEPLDLVLIDGRHGFPAPFIDFFYAAGRLKIGGHLIVDDVALSPCRYMRDLLAEQPQWRLVQEVEHRAAIFEKLADGSELLDWTEQPYVTRRSGVPTPMQVAFRDVCRRDYLTLAGRVWRTVRKTTARLFAQRRDRPR